VPEHRGHASLGQVVALLRPEREPAPEARGLQRREQFVEVAQSVGFERR